MSKTVAIHQPNFFPWLGYFDKIRQADSFVFLDDVMVVKTGGSWFNRVMIPKYDNSAGMWLTVPLKRPSGNQIIKETEIAEPKLWRDKFFKTLQSRYSHSEFKKQTLDLIGSSVPSSSLNLSEVNMAVIRTISTELGFSCKFIISSDLNINLESTAKLVEITRAVGAETYLCGGGASDYFEEPLFSHASKKVRYQNFKPAPYSQGKSTNFLAGMSIIDTLMNIGVSGTKKLLTTHSE